jgi:hypothetical protein
VAVDAEISRKHLRDELALVKQMAAANRWGVIPDYERLTVLVTMYAHTGDLFIVEARCDNYKEVPPFLEFVDPDTGVRGTRHAYPKTTDSLFHDSGPCVCAPFSRKAYKSVDQAGPHTDWQLGDWMTTNAGGMQGVNYSKLGDILGLFFTRLSRPDLFRGRMG